MMVDQTMRLNCLTIKLLYRRHADHIRSHESDCEDVLPRDEVDDVPIPVIQPTPVNAPVSVELRRSQRVRKPPERFQS